MENYTATTEIYPLSLHDALPISNFLNLNPLAKGANERVVLALIGGHNQGRGDALRAIAQGGQFKTFCDIDQDVLDKLCPDLEKAQQKAPGTTKEFRRVLDDKDIDGVMIAVPDHWHTMITLLALQAGKDVYIEKPLSQTIHEGHLIRDAARKYNRVVQVGTQNRSSANFRNAVEYIKSGKLGKICEISTWMCQVRPTIGNPPDSAPPPTVDYDVWLGNAPKRPFNANRFHYTWRFFWDYGNTELGNQGVHMLDVALWGIQALRGLENCLPTHVSGNSGIYWLKDAKEIPDTQVLTYDYGDFMLTWELRSFAKHHPIDGSTEGIAFIGAAQEGGGRAAKQGRGLPQLCGPEFGRYLPRGYGCAGLSRLARRRIDSAHPPRLLLGRGNDAMARMYGLTSGRELLGKRLMEMLDPKDPRNIELAREYVRSGFHILERESHETDIHGNPRVFRNSMIGIVESGKLVRTWGIQRDVTEQVRLDRKRVGEG